MMYFIYIIQNLINKKLYVGKTKNANTRWRTHINIADGGKEKYPQHYQYIHNSIKKYGKNNFEYQVIEELENEELLAEAEQFWIIFFRSWDREFGYNLTLGGEGAFGRQVSQNTRDKIRKNATGRKASSETRRKISDAGKLRKNSPETREKISKSNKGRKMTEEQNKSNSERQIGKKMSSSTIEKMKKSAKHGEKSHKAKLTNEQASEMRKLFTTGNYFIKDLVKLYGVSTTTASYIINKKTYKQE